MPVKVRHGDKAWSAQEQVRSRLAPTAPAWRAVSKKPVKIKRSLQTTLWFAEAETYAAFCKLLLDAKCALPMAPRSLTVRYSAKAEPLINEILKKLKEEYAAAIKDIEI